MQSSTTGQPSDGSLDDYRWLTGPTATGWLDAAAAASGLPLTAQVAQLRSQLSFERSHLVMQQVELRRRASAKFAAAQQMFFTSRGLEQASDEIVAEHKAKRFFGRELVFDLCCGIGGDLLALARGSGAAGFDSDPIMAVIAECNARAGHGGRATVSDLARRYPRVEVRDVKGLDPGECSAWHIDPDRRPSGRRTTLVDLHEPGPMVIEQLLAKNPHAGIKLAPAAQLPPAWLERAELEWISRARQCRQLVAWFGDLAQDQGQRRATVLGAAGQLRTLVGAGDEEPPVADKIGSYLFEPDAAVLAARLSGTLAAQHGLAAIAPGVAYWTGAEEIDDPALGCFEVQEVLPFRIKPLKALLRANDIGQLEIKKRGVEHDPAELRRQLGLSGRKSAVLLLARLGRRVMAILARRVRDT